MSTVTAFGIGTYGSEKFGSGSLVVGETKFEHLCIQYLSASAAAEYASLHAQSDCEGRELYCDKKQSAVPVQITNADRLRLWLGHLNLASWLLVLLLIYLQSNICFVYGGSGPDLPTSLCLTLDFEDHLIPYMACHGQPSMSPSSLHRSYGNIEIGHCRHLSILQMDEHKILTHGLSRSVSNQSTRTLAFSTKSSVSALSIHTSNGSSATDPPSNGNNTALRACIGPPWPHIFPRAELSNPIVSPRSDTVQTATTTFTSVSINDNPENNIRLLDVRLNLICNWLHQKQLQRLWSIGELGEGTMLKKSKDEYFCCPPELSLHSKGLYDTIRQMNVRCAMTVNTRTIKFMLDTNQTASIPLKDGLRLQVLSNLTSLSKCQKNQFAAFVRNPPILVVWDDDPAHIIDRIEEFESKMVSMICKDQPRGEDSKYPMSAVNDTSNWTKNACDIEAAHSLPRKTILIQPLIVAATLFIVCAALGAGWRNIAIEIEVQKTWLCLAFPILGPIQAWLGLFFFQTLPTCIAQIIGPVRQMKENSRFFSGKASPRLPGPVLPHVTIQCPVYKESLAVVIEPTIKSIKAAISIYEMQGGTANIFVNDDGMQLISDEMARERRDLYEEHNIGWVARPKHNAKSTNSEKLFIRAGKFRKASNMNYGLNVSMRVEDKLQYVRRSEDWTAEQEQAAYNEALASVIAEDEGRTWAAGNVRIGDYILLVDSDTRVPCDCLLDAVSEMEQSSDVAILQFSSGVMNVTESWFEKGITFFTNLVYTSIEFAVANGDVAPFVGHNAFLKWSAIQDVAYPAPDKSAYQIFWSEDTVSEDFDMALRLQTCGYSIRLAAYAHGGFKEGVSLTVYDELARWEKYAYGCSELVFHPLSQWIFRGPFTPLFRKFIFSSMPFHSKVSIVAYIGTYFAIASSWLLTLLNYFLIGWFNGYLDHYYMESFKIYFSIVFVFNIVGNVALAILRYRIKEAKLLPALLENFKWVILLATFLGGVSLHVSQAIVCRLFSINMTWGATSKEAKNTSFFYEIPVILRKFRLTFSFCLVMSAMMVVLSGVGPFKNVVPFHWQITRFTAVFPLASSVATHAMLPLALNPGLMQFTF